MRCKSGAKCDEQAIDGKRFCAVHLDQLSRIREELEAEAQAKTKVQRKPTCQTPGCANPRIPPNPLCSECAEATGDELAA